MKVAGEYVFEGPREEVWELLRDPEVLASALPGTQSLNKLSDTEFEGQMHVQIGPVSGVFAGKLIVSDEVPPESCTLSVDGRGQPGFVRGTGRVRLTDQGDGTTLLKYEGDVNIGGRLASVGQRMIDTVSKSMIRQGLEAVNNALKARMAARAGQQEITYKPPSETQFAAAVARDVASDVLASSRALQAAIAVIVVVVVVAVILLLK